ncbi:enoyl-CoA hydratase/isomerase family protein [Ottowia thiooxydans]|uniref:enoyl-CoA hydratase/isomerase family protein n=1 Tax=Ottowia thiooxydans TaxID=219182 RepID=UPI0003F8B7F0|nr:enoyl-CoA hydratase-related protein [Ottowia thiooxydans]
MSGAIHSEMYGQHIALIRIDRPEARNALSPKMLCALADAFLAAKRDVQVRAVVLTGTGDAAFCSGGDLGLTLPLMTGARAPQDEFDRRLLEDERTMEVSSLRNFDIVKPTICAINGTCLAGGFELMLGTDIRIAADHAQFGLPEVQRALLPFAGSMARLPRQVPAAVAMQVLLTGRPFSAQQALQWGLVTELHPREHLQARALELAEQIASNGPIAVQAVRRAAIQGSGLPLHSAFALEDGAKREVMSSEDAREGPLAFMEKRAPRFVGR